VSGPLRQPVSPFVALEVWYCRTFRSWAGRYVHHVTREELGACWYDATRDRVLVFRPPTPDPLEPTTWPR
jgi:hypothetical protein